MAILIPRGYRSTAEYHFREEQADDIVRVVSYPREDYCRSVIWFPPHEHVDIRLSIATPFWEPSNAGLGSLDRLPFELLREVLLDLDMHTLFIFRQVNRRSRQMVDSVDEYQKVVSHGLNLLCVLLRTQLAIGVSLFDFYSALCTKACTICGQFGGFISLLTWTRCCFKCLDGALEAQVQPLGSVRREFQLTKAESNQLKSFKTLPGIYSIEACVQKVPVKAVSVHQAISVSGRQLPALPRIWRLNKKFNFMGSCALPHYDTRTGNVEYGMACAGCQLALEKGIIGSRGVKGAFEARDRLYARDGFLEHFRRCEQAQLLWRSSDEGTLRPPELPEAARKRGYFRDRE
ncbi:hypothetical protein GGS26DRAFT_573829 [Hypomontagnella submonticulosa]|nr:hypothetical protein GGS26DRAFT_573829 [Hypomontagnella submonticulosa]